MTFAANEIRKDQSVGDRQQRSPQFNKAKEEECKTKF